MGVFDKFKNMFFEEEEVEVEVVPPKKKEEKKHEDVKEEVKPIAKKIVLNDEDDDEQEEKVENNVPDEIFKKNDNNSFNLIDDDYEDTYTEETQEEEKDDFYSHKDSYQDFSYKEEERVPYGASKNSNPYPYSVSKETKPSFKPSPIISPIYGILDKNYKKDDIISKRETRHISSFEKESITVDDIRNKAYGDIEDRFDSDTPTIYDNKSLVEEEKVVDLKESKPEVKIVTVGDADEYYNDLGLEYNVDYVDSTKEIKKEDKAEDKKEEVNENIDDDNLFDLIDSMYKDKE